MSDLTISFLKDVHNLVTTKRYPSQQNLDFDTGALFSALFHVNVTFPLFPSDRVQGVTEFRGPSLDLELQELT